MPNRSESILASQHAYLTHRGVDTSTCEVFLELNKHADGAGYLSNASLGLLGIDVKGAFPSVDHGRLMRCAVSVGIPGWILTLWWQLLNVTCRVSFGACGLSEERTLCRGQVQGSCSSPFLWILYVSVEWDGETKEELTSLIMHLRRYINDEAESRGVKGSVAGPAYSDDLLLILAAENDDAFWELFKIVDEAIPIVLNQHGLATDPEKSKLLTLSRSAATWRRDGKNLARKLLWWDRNWDERECPHFFDIVR